MARPKTDPFEATAGLIANAIGTARVFGENARITRLVASTVGKFVLALDEAPGQGPPGSQLAHYALAQISEQDALFIPQLHAALQALLPERPGSRRQA